MVLTQIVHSVKGPCTLSIDAAWGNGKSTFLRLWAQYLRNLKFPVIEFNAWETDFCCDPFLALSEAVTNGLGNRAESKNNKLRETAKEIIRRAVPGVIRLGTAGILDLHPLLDKEFGNVLSSLAEERMASYEEQQKSLSSFRDILQNIANEIMQDGKPLVIMIDELDRCRPDYAIQFLEITKHLFSVDHVIFVFSINRSELEHSVKAIYGNEFNGDGYLRRFSDIDFRLPKPDRSRLISELIESTEIHHYFKRTKDPQAHGDGLGVTEDIVKIFLDKGNIRA